MADALKLAYYVALKEGGSYLGGLLVTDTSGIPLDFRYTEPITPTKLQTVLYGKALESHLKEEVIQKTLIKEMKGVPDLFFVPVADLVGGWTGELRFPVLSTQKTQDPPLARLGETLRVSSREVLVQVSEGAAPLRVIFASGMDMASQELALGRIQEAGYHMDLVEPLERVYAALQALLRPE
jgi:hypothetical protein